MERNVAIITGGSAGIGKALVKLYASKGFAVYSISRSENEGLKLPGIEQVKFDLSDSLGIEAMFNEIWNKIDVPGLSAITLINNAGTLGTISRIENIEPETIQNAIALNFTAPMIMSSLFIKKTAGLEISKKIVNISSGAASNPYYGWTTYCTTKAALDMMVKTIGVEQQTQDYGVKIISVYPGVVETAMQDQIRKTSEEDFLDVQRFRNLKENDQLANPDDVAQKIFTLEMKDEIETGGIIDVREL
ncbi:MAG: (S)-benzoin forming benzil reductase [Bacteroidetes bacterium]|nr:(S)-benzoin forming benzil reductase [Bacteroidota bacterium]